METYQELVDEINESSNVDFDIDEKYNNIIEYYKFLAIKIILSSESTMFKICKSNNWDCNLNDSSIYIHLNMFVKKILFDVVNMEVQNDISNTISQLNILCNCETVSTSDKLFFIIYNFYSNFDRSNVPLDDLQKFQDYIKRKIDRFIKNNKNDILEVMKDSNYEWNGEYSLEEIEEFLNNEDSDSDTD